MPTDHTAFPAASTVATVAVVGGLLGGTGIVLAEVLSTEGPMIFFPYTLTVLGAALVLRRLGETRLLPRFAGVVATYMVATIVAYVSLGLDEGSLLPTFGLWDHTWRLGLMLGIGAVVCLVASLLAGGDGDRVRAVPGRR